MWYAVIFNLIFATIGLACIRDFSEERHTHSHVHRDLSKREVEYPPVLTEPESILVNSFDNNSISDWSYYYTHGDHLAGHNKTMAEWTKDRWTEFGFAASLAEYYVYVTYPKNVSLSLKYSNGSSYDASFQEDMLEEDDTSSYPNRTPVYHGMSGSGNVSAEYVYVGRGTQADFARLKALGVELEGKIALSNYGGLYRGLKVKNAQDNGMIGCVIFTDPLDDGNITVANGYEAYPNGPARNPSSIQRGSVRFSSLYSGDPTTIGYASTKDAPRGDTSPYNPTIPSVPISMRDALPILKAIEGYGLTSAEVNRSGYVGKLDVAYSSGPAPGVTLDLVNLIDSWITPIWDVIGVVNGTCEDEVVILGNHRDAWVIGGAADPNSGTAVLVELSKAFGKLLETGWKPKRTIILASWDAEEFGLQGSTEWVEDNLPWLNASTVAYINVDIAVSGPRPSLSGTGELHTIATELMKKVLFPEEYEIGKTLYDAWYDTEAGDIYPLGSGSDFAAFSQNGMSAMDFGSSNSGNDPIYHYHSNFDSYHWISTFADPGFKLHTSVGQYLAILLFHLVDSALIPFDMPNAAKVLKDYYADLQATIATANVSLDTSAMEAALEEFEDRAEKIEAAGDCAVALGDENTVNAINAKLRYFQRGFASQGGLPRRSTFKNVITAPGLDNGYGSVTYPPITEAVEQKNLTLATEWVEKTSKAILAAAEILKLDT